MVLLQLLVVMQWTGQEGRVIGMVQLAKVCVVVVVRGMGEWVQGNMRWIVMGSQIGLLLLLLLLHLRLMVSHLLLLLLLDSGCNQRAGGDDWRN